MLGDNERSLLTVSYGPFRLPSGRVGGLVTTNHPKIIDELAYSVSVPDDESVFTGIILGDALDQAVEDSKRGWTRQVGIPTALLGTGLGAYAGNLFHKGGSKLRRALITGLGGLAGGALGGGAGYLVGRGMHALGMTNVPYLPVDLQKELGVPKTASVSSLTKTAAANMLRSTSLTKQAGLKRDLSRGFSKLMDSDYLAKMLAGGITVGGLAGGLAGGRGSTAIPLGVASGALAFPLGAAYALGTGKLNRGLGIMGAGLGLPVVFGIGERIVRPILYNRERERELAQAQAELEKSLELDNNLEQLAALETEEYGYPLG